MTSTVAIAMAASQDGLWTGHDWVDAVNGISDSDGILSAIATDTMRRMRSASIYMGDDLEDIYLTMKNVQNV